MPAHAAVETSKVFIREVMAIDPLWLTELAYGPSANVAGLIRESGWLTRRGWHGKAEYDLQTALLRDDVAPLEERTTAFCTAILCIVHDSPVQRLFLAHASRDGFVLRLP